MGVTVQVQASEPAAVFRISLFFVDIVSDIRQLYRNAISLVGLSWAKLRHQRIESVLAGNRRRAAQR